MKLTSRLTTLFDIKYPIMSAPMSMHSGATLAAAVTNAGGVGMFGAIGSGGEAWFIAELDKAKSLLGDKPFGVGFITFLMESIPHLFDIAIEAKVPVMAFSFANPAPYIERARTAGSVTICQVRNMEQAAEAVAAGTDILVAQGNEAGGHTGQTNLMPVPMTRCLRRRVRGADYSDSSGCGDYKKHLCGCGKATGLDLTNQRE